MVLYKTCYFFPFSFLYSMNFIALKTWLQCYFIKYKSYLQKRCYHFRFYYDSSFGNKERYSTAYWKAYLACFQIFSPLDSFLVSLLQINWISQCFSSDVRSFLPLCLCSIYFFHLMGFPLFLSSNPIHISSLNHIGGDFLDTWTLWCPK